MAIPITNLKQILLLGSSLGSCAGVGGFVYYKHQQTIVEQEDDPSTWNFDINSEEFKHFTLPKLLELMKNRKKLPQDVVASLGKALKAVSLQQTSKSGDSKSPELSGDEDEDDGEDNEEGDEDNAGNMSAILTLLNSFFSEQLSSNSELKTALESLKEVQDIANEGTKTASKPK